VIASGPVKRAVKLLLICTMLALIPLRGIAAIAVGICAAGDQQNWGQSQAGHGHSSHERTADSRVDQKNADCRACVEHCAGVSFVAPAASGPLPELFGGDRVAPGERFAAGHVPEHLDPPPLAS
jgi:hypothetical protein